MATVDGPGGRLVSTTDGQGGPFVASMTGIYPQLLSGLNSPQIFMITRGEVCLPRYR